MVSMQAFGGQVNTVGTAENWTRNKELSWEPLLKCGKNLKLESAFFATHAHTVLLACTSFRDFGMDFFFFSILDNLSWRICWFWPFKEGGVDWRGGSPA